MSFQKALPPWLTQAVNDAGDATVILKPGDRPFVIRSRSPYHLGTQPMTTLTMEGLAQQILSEDGQQALDKGENVQETLSNEQLAVSVTAVKMDRDIVIKLRNENPKPPEVDEVAQQLEEETRIIRADVAAKLRENAMRAHAATARPTETATAPPPETPAAAPLEPPAAPTRPPFKVENAGGETVADIELPLEEKAVDTLIAKLSTAPAAQAPAAPQAGEPAPQAPVRTSAFARLTSMFSRDKDDSARREQEEAARREQEEATRRAQEDAADRSGSDPLTAIRKREDVARRAQENAVDRTSDPITAIRKREEVAALAQEEAARREQDDAARRAQEEAKRREHEEAARRAEEEASRDAEAAARRAREEAALREQEEIERRAQEAAARREEEEAARIAQEEAERREQEDAVRRAQEEAARLQRERLAQEEAEAARREKEDAARREAEARAREEAEAARLAQEEAERCAREDAARREREDAARREREELARREQEDAARRELEEKARLAQEEAAAARRELEQTARRAQEEAETARRELAEVARRAQEEAARRHEEELALRAQEDAARREREELARREQEDAARRELEEQTRRAHEEAEAARRELAEVARRAQEDAARRELEEQTRRAQEEAEAARRELAEVARREQEEAARREQEEAARGEQEEVARRERDASARREQEDAGRRDLEEKARIARAEADAARRELAEVTRRAQEDAARRDRESAARLERERAARRAQEDAARREQEQAERRALKEATRRRTIAETADADGSAEAVPARATVVDLSRRGPLAATTELTDWIVEAMDQGATALYLRAGKAPFARIDGQVEILSAEPIPLSLFERAGAAMSAGEDGWQPAGEWAWTKHIPGAGSVHCQTFTDGQGGGFIVQLPVAVTALDEQVPRHIRNACDTGEGLVVVSAPFAEDVAAMLGAVVAWNARRRAGHIISFGTSGSLERVAGNAFVSDRPLPSGDHAMTTALQGALRERPDMLVVLAGGPLPAVDALISAAVGRLVIVGVVARTAPRALETLMTGLNSSRHMLAANFKAACSWRGFRTASGRRLVVSDTLVASDRVSTLIDAGDIAGLHLAQFNREEGMRAVDAALAAAVARRKITLREAAATAVDRKSLISIVRRQARERRAAERHDAGATQRAAAFRALNGA